MGLSCYLCYKPSSAVQAIRVVRLNGSVEDFKDPITVSELTGTPPKYFVCTSAELLSLRSSKTLPPETQLQPGQVYFLLPISTFQSETSPVDLANLSKRLMAAAKRTKSQRKNSMEVLDPSPSLGRSKSTSLNPFSPSRDRSNSTPERMTSPVAGEVCSSGDEVSYRTKPWKPILETIVEKSFSRRSDFSHPSESFRQMEFRV